MNRNNPSSKRLFRCLLLIIIAALVFVPVIFADAGRKYAVISLLVALLSVMLFGLGYDRKLVGAGRGVICAVLIALSVIGRFIPVFKPVSAVTILCALYLGRECGFLCGSLSALISDLSFGLGPWTPFQMFAWGLIGYISGVLSKPLKAHRSLLLTFGALCGVLFSMIMDVWTVLWYNGSLELSLYVSAIVTALPYTAVYSLSNIIFLSLLARPFGEKLERINLKYGI